MRIREIIAKLFGFDAEKHTIQSELTKCQYNVDTVTKKLNELQTRYDALQINQHPKKEFWDNRKPKADIYYTGRVIPNRKEQVTCDVRNFITLNDADIRKNIETYGLKILNPLQCNSDILKIYRWHQEKFFKYSYDDINFGTSEMWLMPFESRILWKNGLGTDCEDFSHSLISYLITAGLPSWRVRVVCGMTWDNFGHSTVYVLDDNLETWRHMNSTNSLSMIPKEFNSLPKSNDETDIIGIKDVWFSFSSYASWHTFETSASKQSYNEEKAMKNITIRRK